MRRVEMVVLWSRKIYLLEKYQIFKVVQSVRLLLSCLSAKIPGVGRIQVLRGTGNKSLRY